MTARKWKPGDVAMIEVGCHANRFVGMFTHRGWRYGPDKWVADDPIIVTARPLVVIDPESREQVERLDDLLWMTVDDDGQADMQAALREFATPTSPKPAEPQNVGAVVTARDGTRWTRVESATDTFSRNPWYPAAESDIQPREWDEIDAVTVLSEGVTP